MHIKMYGYQYLQANIHIHDYIHIYDKHTSIYTYSTCIFIFHANSHVFANIFTCICISMRMCTCTMSIKRYIHTVNAYSGEYACMYVDVIKYMHACISICICTCMMNIIYLYMHMYFHIRAYIYRLQDY
jgi:membrane-associated HD superfamily phosphohydrolase